MEDRTDRILSKYGLRRERARVFVDTIVRSNQTETAEEMDVSRPTVRKYKDRFAEMSEEERAFLVSSLLAEKYRYL